ncbi:MAG: hypothetical protein KF830_09335 [Planctomycetes bacterium]|nr:hypothetical protein [Planctomycetota bacterium]
MRPLALGLLLAACVAPPEPGVRPTALQSLQRPLVPDLTPAAFTTRMHGLAFVLGELAEEPARLHRALSTPERVLAGTTRRADALAEDVVAAPRAELGRLADLEPNARAVGPLLLPDGDAAHRRAAAARLLGVAKPPLDEISDRHHRTDPDDDAPEMALPERVLRRLRL